MPEENLIPAPKFRSDVTVELVKHTASDADVLFAARVSTKGESSLEDVNADASKSQGLLNYLMRDRHGCYDDQTEVLTADGWVAWPDVTGQELFATLDPVEGDIVYQRAHRLIAKHYDGPMLAIRKEQVDLLVTPDHMMLAKRRLQPHRERWGIVPASDLIQASHRIKIGGGFWAGDEQGRYKPGVLPLLGFFIGDGNISGSLPTLHIRKAREITFLHQQAAVAGFEIRRDGESYALACDEDFRLLAKSCYNASGDKVIPREVLQAPGDQLAGLLLGLMSSDGSVSPSGRQTYSTTSDELAGQIQEVALKLGRAAVIRERPFSHDEGHYGYKPRYGVTIHRGYRMRPKIGWTTADRAREVTVEQYTGKVYCVTVPNGTLYVRRNGVPAWSGNSPFEHNSMTFYVQAPIFVFREFMRHRIASYNEESGRYRELQPVFYVPGPDRNLQQVGKPGAYDFLPGTDEQHGIVNEATRRSCEVAYAAYQEMLAAGVAREIARIVLPVTTYSSMYVTMNARALMNFLSLRTKREDSRFPSFPQREIEMVAEKMEAEWARLMPLTHTAFEANGRVSP